MFEARGSDVTRCYMAVGYTTERNKVDTRVGMCLSYRGVYFIMRKLVMQGLFYDC